MSHYFFLNTAVGQHYKDFAIRFFTDAVIEMYAKLSEIQNTIPTYKARKTVEPMKIIFFHGQIKDHLMFLLKTKYPLKYQKVLINYFYH